jgi:hypothetical protein
MNCFGDEATFSDLEQQGIILTWLGVAEIYSPFDIDVTTECTDDDMIRYNLSDPTYGCRAQLTNYSYIFPNQTRNTFNNLSILVSGIAQKGVFGDIGEGIPCTLTHHLTYPLRRLQSASMDIH